MAFHPRRQVHHRALKKDREAGRDQKRQAKAERRAARRFDKVYGTVSDQDPTSGMPDDPLYTVEADRPPTVEQFPSAWPEAPEPVAGVARTLSRGL